MTEPTNCWNCGTALFKQWGDRSKGGYVCKVCGALTPAVIPRGPSRELFLGGGCLLAILALGSGALAWLVSVGGQMTASDDTPYLLLAVLLGAAAVAMALVGFRRR
jgi:hypothetical protein